MGMTVICGPTVKTRGFDSGIAQSRAYEYFLQDFKSRYPQGVVMTEYEYMARTTFAGTGGTPVQFPGKPLISQLVSGMSDSFRRGVNFADFRKPDGIGLVELGRSVRVELLEVTTETNQKSAKSQMVDKTAILSRTVVGSLGSPFPVEVVGTPWKPSGYQITYPAIPDRHNNEVARWVCYLPTMRNTPPDGVILYEMHAVNAPADWVQAPDFSSDTEEVIKREFAKARAKRASATETGQSVPTTSPAVRSEISNIVALVGIGVTIGAVAALCVGAVVDPVPGDEVVVCGFALKVVETSLRAAPAF